MAAVFPNWDGRDTWAGHMMRSMANGSTEGEVKIQRDGRIVEASMIGSYWYMEISGTTPKVEQ